MRGKIKVNIQWLLYCMIHNLEKTVNYGVNYGFTKEGSNKEIDCELIGQTLIQGYELDRAEIQLEIKVQMIKFAFT